MNRQFKPAQSLPIAFSRVWPGLPNAAAAGPVWDATDSDGGEPESAWPRFGISAGIMCFEADGVLDARPGSSPIESDRCRGIHGTGFCGPIRFAGVRI